VLVFPEGTRSPDGRIQRFHKGAFYLAKKLNMEIQPIIIHGTGHCLGKGELYMKTGALHIRFLPRLKPEEIPAEENLIRISREYTRIYREKYAGIVEIEETPRYFRRHLVRNYIYKGPVLEWYLRVKTRMEKDYAVFHQHLPKAGQITDIGCGYGFLGYMMTYLSWDRHILGIDYDEEKIAVANHCPAKSDRTRFIASDALETEIPVSDAIVISDVLHYMPEEEQEKLIRKCIEKLKPGGIMMIRDADREMEKEHAWTRLSEFLSTRIGFNRTITEDRMLYFTSGRKIMTILKENGLVAEILPESRTMSNVIFVGKKNN
jgi:2-polyprenyl-3-methyl-5-hydroxy-6-metoxy-1,4-benzoquinol methylase